jgi:thiamine-phosphate pyrophosphorylase
LSNFPGQSLRHAPIPFGHRLLLITDGWSEETPAQVAGAVSAETAVQLRAKGLSGRALLDAAQKLRPLAPTLLVNDRVDVALAAGADGVHLPSRGLDVKNVRKIVPPGFVIGVSTHSLAEARMAQKGGADYVVFGPVFATTKTQPVGLDALAEVVEALTIPVFALGGVTVCNAADCAARGARVACIGAVFRQPDPAAAARALRERLSGSPRTPRPSGVEEGQ